MSYGLTFLTPLTVCFMLSVRRLPPWVSTIFSAWILFQYYERCFHLFIVKYLKHSIGSLQFADVTLKLICRSAKLVSNAESLHCNTKWTVRRSKLVVGRNSKVRWNNTKLTLYYSVAFLTSSKYILDYTLSPQTTRCTRLKTHLY